MSAAPAAPAGPPPPGAVDLRLRLPFRPPLDLPALLRFLARRAVPGVESASPGVYRRSLDLPHGAGAVVLAAPARFRRARRRMAPAVTSTPACCSRTGATRAGRAALPAPARPGRRPAAHRRPPGGRPRPGGPLVLRSPGRRVPGHVDGAELALRAVLGQQVTVAGGRALATRLVALHGRPLGPLAGVLPGVTSPLPPRRGRGGGRTGGPARPPGPAPALRALARALAAA